MIAYICPVFHRLLSTSDLGPVIIKDLGDDPHSMVSVARIPDLLHVLTELGALFGPVDVTKTHRDLFINLYQ